MSFHLPPQRTVARQGEEPQHAAAARRRTPPHAAAATFVARRSSPPPPTCWPPAARHRHRPYLAAASVDAFADDNGETVVATHERQQARFNLILYMRQVHS